MIKNDNQIKGIRSSSKLAADVLVYIEPFIIDGNSTFHINELIEKFITNRGGIPAPLNYKGFPAATCISINDTVCHGIPDDTVIKNGDIVGIDVATILDGYFGDTCYTFMVGDIADKVRKLLNIAKNSLYIGIHQVKDGCPVGNIGYEINKYVERNQYSICSNFTGHGVGNKFHEDLVIPHIGEKNTGVILREGMTLTIEPIVNAGKSDVIFEGWVAKTADHRISAQFEHTILVQKNGCEILTDSPLWAMLL